MSDLPPLPMSEVQRLMKLADEYADSCAGRKASVFRERSALEAALREALPRTLEERMAALTPRSCDLCDGTLEPNTNGYSAYLRCVKCSYVPM